MKYLFILGRNVELSKAEVLSFLQRFDYKIINFFLKENALIVEIDRKLEQNSLEKLGGVIAIGEVLSIGNLNDVLKNLDKKELYFGKSNKFNYVIWNYSNDAYLEVSEYIKKRFNSEKLKSTEKQLTGQLKLQDEKRVAIVGSSLIDEQFFIFSRKEPSTESEEFYFGKIIEYCDYKELEKRDMKKPVRRSELAISPRLSKIMINLSQVGSRSAYPKMRNSGAGKLVDAFCGIGVILYEALLQDLKVIGIDIDKKAIEGAKKNLAWGKFKQSEYVLINNDSRKVRIKPAEVLVSEPDLGMTLRKVLMSDKRERKTKIKIVRKTYSKQKAEQMLEGFESLLIEVLNNLKNSVSKRFVFTSPLIKTREGRISCNIEKILEKTGLKLVEGFPIQEFREGKTVGRDIFVLEH